MSESFSVGEVAIWVREGSPNYGREVTIAGPLQLVNAWQPDGSCIYDYRYPMDADFAPVSPHGNGWCAHPDWLKKRRPPQDWVKLCQLDNLPQTANGFLIMNNLEPVKLEYSSEKASTEPAS